MWKTYELNDRILIERNLTKKNKCIIIGGGIGFIGVLTYHITKNKIILFEINNELIELLNSNLKNNSAKYKLFENNLVLDKKFNKTHILKLKILFNSIYRKSKKNHFLEFVF